MMTNDFKKSVQVAYSAKKRNWELPSDFVAISAQIKRRKGVV